MGQSESRLVANVLSQTSRNGQLHPQDSQKLLRMLRAMSHKENALILSGSCKIGPVGATNLAKALESLPRLRRLDLAGNGIGDRGVAALAAVLDDLMGLQDLDISRNGIGVEGAAALASTLGLMTGLQSLALSGNSIGPKGTMALAGALGRLKGLEELFLSRNDVGDKGAAALAGALENMTGLRSLYLSYNEISEKGAAALCGALEGLTGLRTLGLQSNNIVAEATVLMPLARLRFANPELTLMLDADSECVVSGLLEKLEQESDAAVSARNETRDGGDRPPPDFPRGTPSRNSLSAGPPPLTGSSTLKVLEPVTLTPSNPNLKTKLPPLALRKDGTAVQPSALPILEPGSLTPVKPWLASNDVCRRLQKLDTVGDPVGMKFSAVDLQYLGRVLQREGNLKAVEDEQGRILKDPRAGRYYQGLQQSLCWLFTGARAYKSGLVKKGHGIVSTALIQASSQVAGLLPMYGHVAQGAVSFGAGQIADYFEGKSAERIARAGGSDERSVAEGVARLLVFARMGVLSRLPLGSGQRPPSYEKGVAEVVKADVSRMMTWLKGEGDLDLIREDADLAGEAIVRRLVEAAEPAWGKAPVTLVTSKSVVVASTTFRPLTAGPGRGGVSAGGDTSLDELREKVRKFEEEKKRGQEELRSMKARLQTLEAEMPGPSLSTFTAGSSQLFVGARVQQHAAGLGVRGDASTVLLEYEQVQDLSIRVAAIEGRVDYNERLYAKEVPSRSSKVRKGSELLR